MRLNDLPALDRIDETVESAPVKRHLRLLAGAEEGPAKPGFPLDCLPTPLRQMAWEVSESLNVDPAMPAIGGLAAAATAVGNAVRVRVSSIWQVPLSGFFGVLSPSGSRKSAALGPMLSPLKKIQAERIREYKLEADNYQEQKRLFDHRVKEATKKGQPLDFEEPQPAVLEQLIGSDATVPALAQMLNANRRGVLVHRDELAGWIASLDAGRERGESGIQSWIELFNGSELLVNRKTNNEKIFISSPFVVLLGGIQPAIARRIIRPEHFESGLMARFLLCRPERKPKRWVDTEPSPEATSQWEQCINRLMEIPIDPTGGGQPWKGLPMDETATQAFKAIQEELYRQQNRLDELDPRAAWLARCEEHHARLAGLLFLLGSIGAGKETAGSIDKQAVESAWELLQWFDSERRFIETELKEPAHHTEDRQLVAFLEQSPTRRDFRNFCSRFRDANVLDEVLAPYIENGLGAWEKTDSTGGRPSVRFVLRRQKVAESPKVPVQTVNPTGT